METRNPFPEPVPSDTDGVSHLRGTLEQVKLVGSGGMAQIFRARQPSLGRYVAIKRLKDELSLNDEARERFRREARALASVLHQNVAHVYDYVESGRDAYIIMEYIEGIDISSIVRKVGALPPRVAAALALGIAKGAGYIHSHNLIHRDIKPSNVRVTPYGEVKLMDFGIVVDLGNHTLTRPGLMVGSPAYLSPEQVLGDPITPQADQFLIGICLYEMLVGTRPFQEGAGQTLFQRIREVRFTPLREMQPTVPRELEAIVHRCLSKEPERRFPSVKELIFSLEQFLGPEASAHPQDGILRFLDEEALLTPRVPYGAGELHLDERGLRLPRWAWGAVALALLGAVFAAGFRVGRESGWQDKLDVQSRYGAPKDLPDAPSR